MSDIAVFGSFKPLDNLFALMPKIAVLYFRKFLYKEKRAFIGNKSGTKGSFRSGLDRRKLRGRPGQWRRGGVSSAFTGDVKNKSTLDMSLNVGIPDQFYKKFPFLDALNNGAVIRAVSKRFLLVPIYENLPDVTERIGFGSNAKNNWTKWRQKNQDRIFMFSPAPGRVIVADKFTKKPMWVSKSSVTIKKRIDFPRAAQRKYANITARAEKVIDRMVSDFEQNRVQNG